MEEILKVTLGRASQKPMCVVMAGPKRVRIIFPLAAALVFHQMNAP